MYLLKRIHLPKAKKFIQKRKKVAQNRQRLKHLPKAKKYIVGEVHLLNKGCIKFKKKN